MRPDAAVFEETKMPIDKALAPFLFGLAGFAFLIGLGFVFWRVSRTRNGSDTAGFGSYVPVNSPELARRETRKETRTDVNWAVSMDTSQGVAVGIIRNVSLSGAFVCCKKPLPLGEVFHVTMIGPDGDPATATAEVIWSNAAVPDEKVINRGMGVRLTRVPDKHIRWVQQILQEGSQQISLQ